MNIFLIFTLTLCTLSAFANCDVSISGNMKKKRVEYIKEVLTERGYYVTQNATSYRLDVTGEKQKIKHIYVAATLFDLQRKDPVYNTSKTIYADISTNRGYSSNQWDQRVIKVLKNLPSCNEVASLLENETFSIFWKNNP